MKVGLKTIFFVGDDDGFADAISGALHPPPDSSIQKLEESFEFSLALYGIKDHKAAGTIVHYVDDAGVYQVSVLHLQNYKMKVLPKVLSEVLQHIRYEESSERPTLVFPFFFPSSKPKIDTEYIKSEDKGSLLYGIHLGPETGVSQVLAAKTPEQPILMRISHEPLARVHHIVRVLNLATFIIIGQEGQQQDLELINKIGELLGDDSCLSYSKEKLVLDSPSVSRKHAKPQCGCALC